MVKSGRLASFDGAEAGFEGHAVPGRVAASCSLVEGAVDADGGSSAEPTGVRSEQWSHSYR